MHINSDAVNIFAAILVLWTIPWKIYAVWLAVKREDKKWFFALVILNTFAILEIYYIFKVVGKNWEEVKQAFREGWNYFRGTKMKDFRGEEK